MSNVVSMKNKGDFGEPLARSFQEVTGRGVSLVRNAGSRLTAVTAALALLGIVAAKANVPSVRNAAAVSHDVIGAQAAPIAKQPSAAVIVAQRPTQVRGPTAPHNRPTGV